MLGDIDHRMYLPKHATSETGEVLARVGAGALTVTDARPLLVNDSMTDSERLTMLALAYVASGEVAAAVEVLKYGVQQDPNDLVARANLSHIWYAYGFIGTANLAAMGLAESEWADGQELADLISRENRNLVEAREYVNLQRAALEEARESTEESFVGGAAELAANYMMTSQLGDDDLYSAAAELYEEADQRSGNSNLMKLGAVQAYSKAGEHGRADEIFRTIDRKMPSPSTPIGDVNDDQDQSREWQRQNQLMSLVNHLTSICLEKTDGWEAAIADLRGVFERATDNASLYEMVSLAELAIGRADNAMMRARRIAGRPDLTHAQHFNIAQVLWDEVAPSLTKYHLRRAWDLAKNEEDRADVLEVKRRLGVEVPGVEEAR